MHSPSTMRRRHTWPAVLLSTVLAGSTIAPAAMAAQSSETPPGFTNGSFESFDGANGWHVVPVEGWRAVDAQTVTPETAGRVNFDALPLSQGLEVWRNYGPNIYFGQNKVELDGNRNSVDGLYQRFAADGTQVLAFNAYGRQKERTNDIEVYIDGAYVDTVTPPQYSAEQPTETYYFPVGAGEHSLLLKEVNSQDNGLGALIDNVRLITPTNGE